MKERLQAGAAAVLLPLVALVVLSLLSAGDGIGRDHSPEADHLAIAADPSSPSPPADLWCSSACGRTGQAKKKKWYQKIGKALSKGLPIVAGLAGGVINNLIPGAGKVIQGLGLLNAEKVKDVAKSQIAYGVGEFVNDQVLGIGKDKAAEEQANREVIDNALGASGSAAPGDLRIVERLAAAAVAGGAGFLVAGPPGAAVAALAGGAVGPSVVDKARNLIKGI